MKSYEVLPRAVKWIDSLCVSFARPSVVFFSPTGGCVIWVLKSSTSPVPAIPVGCSIAFEVVAIRTLVPNSTTEGSSTAILLLNCNVTGPSLVIVAKSERSFSSNVPLWLKSIQP